MIELKDKGVCFTAVHAGVPEKVLQEPLLVDVDDVLLSASRLGFVVVDVLSIVVLAVRGSAQTTAGIA